MQTINKNRFYHLLKETKDQAKLDLSGGKIITEAASGYYTAPVLLAALAGAEVVALGKDSEYGSFAEIKNEIEQHAYTLKVSDKIKITDNRTDPNLIGADIITNHNFVRPIDHSLIEQVESHPAICYMFESWESRSGDVDQEYCHNSNIPVYFSDEDTKFARLFPMSGLIALKMIMESGAALADDRVAVLSSDKFGPIIKGVLKKYSYKTKLFRAPEYDGYEKNRWDIVVVAEFAQKQTIIDNLMPANRLLAQLTPGATIIQFAGANNLESLHQKELNIFPDITLKPQRMAKTFGYLGPRPIIMYNAIGLKIAQAVLEGRKQNLSGEELNKYVLAHSPAKLYGDR